MTFPGRPFRVPGYLSDLSVLREPSQYGTRYSAEADAESSSDAESNFAGQSEYGIDIPHTYANPFARHSSPFAGGTYANNNPHDFTEADPYHDHDRNDDHRFRGNPPPYSYTSTSDQPSQRPASHARTHRISGFGTDPSVQPHPHFDSSSFACPALNGGGLGSQNPFPRAIDEIWTDLQDIKTALRSLAGTDTQSPIGTGGTSGHGGMAARARARTSGRQRSGVHSHSHPGQAQAQDQGHGLVLEPTDPDLDSDPETNDSSDPASELESGIRVGNGQRGARPRVWVSRDT